MGVLAAAAGITAAIGTPQPGFSLLRPYAPKVLAVSAGRHSVPASADGGTRQGVDCGPASCVVRLTPDQLLAQTTRLVAERRFDEAKPLIEALGQAPETRAESLFFTGYLAAEAGDVKGAIRNYRESLAVDPEGSRARLELAHALMNKGDETAADYHLRLVGQSEALDPELRGLVRQQRDLLRMKRNWSVTTRFGFSPDTNINNGTDARTVNADFAGTRVPLALDKQARRRSGVGQTGAIEASWRLGGQRPAGVRLEAAVSGVNYRGKSADDANIDLSIGPELRFRRDRIAAQLAVGQRWYGGKRSHRQTGARVSWDRAVGQGGTLALTVDAMRHAATLSEGMTGWAYGVNLAYERPVARAVLANIAVFARRERRGWRTNSNKEIGLGLGMGAELPRGLNAGLGMQVARARFDAPMTIFSPKRRHDFRLTAQAQLGLRTIRFAGFSPSVSLMHIRNASSLKLYSMGRTRLSFSLARYF